MSEFQPDWFKNVSHCDVCHSQYLTGTPHTCAHSDESESHRRLEKWLGEWTLEPTP